MTNSGRQNQKRRTRKELLRAAARLMRDGGAPTLEDVAAEAMVSRATAYRYFPNAETLLTEAALDIAMPDAETVFADAPATDPFQRLACVDAAFDRMMAANEAALRMMLSHSVRVPLQPGEGDALPARQNRRSPLIEAALEPAKSRFEPAQLQSLSAALALLFGPEAMIVFKDVLQIDEAEARDVRRWAIQALVEGALAGSRVSEEG